MFGKLFAFLNEVRLEAKKVNWPTPQQALQNTLIVLGFSIAVALLLGVFDFLFTRVVKHFLS